MRNYNVSIIYQVKAENDTDCMRKVAKFQSDAVYSFEQGILKDRKLAEIEILDVEFSFSELD